MPEEPRSRAGSLHLIGGLLCLDFANTASGRGTDFAQEHLRSYDDLLSWSVHSGCLTARAHGRLSAIAAATARDASAVMERALALREAIRDLVIALGQGAPVDPRCPALIASEASLAVRSARMRQAKGGAFWDWPDDVEDLARPLWPVARSAFQLPENLDLGRLKRCPSADCGWVFLDRSKNNSRRWCDMSVCGNRSKARRHYRRHAAV